MAHNNEISGSPLKGFVVLDFTWVVAGPQCTRLLADWGAEVYRIEWPQNPDMIRFMGMIPGAKTHEDTFERSGFYNDLNSSKNGVTLNMNSEGGRALFRELLTKADAVIENFSPAAMEKWGFDYEAMRAINPKIIYMSVSGYGHSGPSQYYLTFGPSAQALNGLTHASGLPGEEPAGWGFSYMDQTAGYVGAVAMLMAIYDRERTGVGQYLDLGQSETGMALTGAAFLDAEVNGRSSRRPGFPPGNRASWPGHPVTSAYRADPTVAPHNTYRTRPAADGSDPDNDWVAIACFTDAQWKALVGAMGQPGLLTDPRFATLNARFDNQEALDQTIEGWTKTLHKAEVQARLQAVGVPAGAVQSSRDRVESDPQLAHRGIYQTHGGHPIHGDKLFQEVPVKMTATPPSIKNHAPLMGAANDRFYGKLLGLSPERVRQLVDEGVLWPPALPRPAWIKGTADEDSPEGLRMAGE